MSNTSSCCGGGKCYEPTSCTLADRDQRVARAAVFRDVFAYLERTEPLDGAFRWYFRLEPDLETHLRDVARREHECSRIFDFRITREDSSLVWETRAPDAAASVLAEFMRLPETVSTTTVDGMTRVLSAAGLQFASSAKDPRP